MTSTAAPADDRGSAGGAEPPVNSQKLIRGLLRAAAYPHPVDQLQLIETHISWVVLTGPFAYKIKKPVQFPFVDYSTLEQRHFFCEEELRINQPGARDIYLDVVPIGGTEDQPRIGARGRAIEYAVRMQQFPQDAILNRQIERGLLRHTQIDQLGAVVAGFHREAPRADAQSPFCSPEPLISYALENLDFLGAKLPPGVAHDSIERIARWTIDRAQFLRPFLRLRAEQGHVRRCHGDLHLGNLVRIGDRICLFDAIEFNPHFQWIDCLNDLAFLLMDLHAGGRADLGARLLTVYLEQSGDYPGLQALPFYQVYRAMTRAKVNLLRGLQHRGAPRVEAEELCRHYLELARQYLGPGRPEMWITHGVSATGKSTQAMKIVERNRAVRIRSDVERTRQFAHASDKYTLQATGATYDRLHALARSVLQSGYSVVVDATFLDSSRRRQFRELADDMKASFHILHCTAPPEELFRRIQARRHDASEATLDVLKSQLKNLSPLDDDERSLVVEVN